MCHNMSTPYVYPYTMHVSFVQAPQVDSTNLTPLEMGKIPTNIQVHIRKSVPN